MFGTYCVRHLQEGQHITSVLTGLWMAGKPHILHDWDSATNLPGATCPRLPGALEAKVGCAPFKDGPLHPADTQPSLSPAVTPRPNCTPETCGPTRWYGKGPQATGTPSSARPGPAVTERPAPPGSQLSSCLIQKRGCLGSCQPLPSYRPRSPSPRPSPGEATWGCPRLPRPFQLGEGAASASFNSARRPEQTPVLRRSNATQSHPAPR